MKYLLIYLAVISVISAAVACYDKHASKKRPRHRTPERTLLLLSVMGGSFAMYLTMRPIRHKTQKLKFMLGLPIIFLTEAIAFFIIYLKFFK